MKRTGLIGQQIKSTEVDDIDPTRRVVLQLVVMNKAEVDHAQLLDVFDVDRPATKLVGNERHKLYNVVHLQRNVTEAISNNVGQVFFANFWKVYGRVSVQIYYATFL